VGGGTDRTLLQQQTYKGTLYSSKKQKNQCIRESERGESLLWHFFKSQINDVYTRRALAVSAGVVGDLMLNPV